MHVHSSVLLSFSFFSGNLFFLLGRVKSSRHSTYWLATKGKIRNPNMPTQRRQYNMVEDRLVVKDVLTLISWNLSYERRRKYSLELELKLFTTIIFNCLFLLPFAPVSSTI
jgi:hypothetical protein